MNRLSIALRFLQRDARHGELTLLVLALVIAVTSSTAISLFADRLHRTMNAQAAEFLAADLVVTSSVVVPTAWLNKADDLGLNRARTAEFSTVLIENDELLLAGIKAVSSAYPLRGHLKTKGGVETESIQQSQGPAKGHIWVDNRVLTTLKLSIGDVVTIGENPLSVSHIITYEPDKRGDIYSLSPRVLMNEADLQATNVLQPGSHVHYFFQFSGEPTAISEFNKWVKPKLGVSQRVMDVQDDRPELGSALSRAERYLGLSSILVVLIAGVAIAMSSRRFTERHFNATAIMRCMGCKQNDMVMIFLYQFIVLGLLACSIGLLLGWFVQDILFELLRSLLPAKVSDPSMMAVMFGFLTGFAILIGFALPPLLRLKRVSPLRVLRRELDPINNSSWFVYGLALLLVAGLVVQYTGDVRLMVTIIGGGLVAIVLSGGLIFIVLKQLNRMLPHLSLGSRLGFQGLLSNPTLTTVQIMAFSITLVAMLLSFTVRNDLLSDWQKQLPNDAPNYFALNLFPNQIASFEQQLDELDIPAANLYPVVRGRLVEINGEPVQRHVTKDSQGERAVHRDLSLTWGDELPADNKTLAGAWGQAKKGEVSIESKLAKSLKVAMGDKLTFTIGDEQVKAVVVHIRSVQWDTMKPNFYMVFSEETLENFPVTYITSFYLSEENKKHLNGLVKQFPAMTVLEVDAMLKQIKMILSQLTAAINYLLYFALLAGFTVLFSSVYSTLDNRIAEGALMRTLGANRALLRKAQIVEFSMIGLITGVIAVLMSQLVLFGLYNYVLHLDFKLDVMLCLVVPVLSIVTVVMAGLWGVKDVVKKSPMVVLRES
ncbi:MAG TPA: FtsX-like permease family protein [Cycloclasticus sp.]|nr:FtsX-like permease family protein [Cycloclasticus sp.]HIL91316.1 FtsX-like permease family protein [Cycloclasticus sp.]